MKLDKCELDLAATAVKYELGWLERVTRNNPSHWQSSKWLKTVKRLRSIVENHQWSHAYHTVIEARRAVDDYRKRRK